MEPRPWGGGFPGAPRPAPRVHLWTARRTAPAGPAGPGRPEEGPTVAAASPAPRRVSPARSGPRARGRGRAGGGRAGGRRLDLWPEARRPRRPPRPSVRPSCPTPAAGAPRRAPPADHVVPAGRPNPRRDGARGRGPSAATHLVAPSRQEACVHSRGPRKRGATGSQGRACAGVEVLPDPNLPLGQGSGPLPSLCR